jgi:Tfp pilus assembly protein PilX
MKDRTLLIQDSQGSILIITLLMLMIGSLIAIYATTTSTTETRVANNEKSYTATFYAADAGLDPGISVLLNIFDNRTVATNYGNTGWIGDSQTTLLDVVMGFSNATNKGISFASQSGTTTTNVYFTRQGATTGGTGSSAEFGSGGEGAGYGSASGVFVFYYVNPTASQNATGASVTLKSLYRKVSNVGEGK